VFKKDSVTSLQQHSQLILSYHESVKLVRRNYPTSLIALIAVHLKIRPCCLQVRSWTPCSAVFAPLSPPFFSLTLPPPLFPPLS